jgi:hypothetical protein
VRGALYSNEHGPFWDPFNLAGRQTVQRWVDDPAANQGLIVQDTTNEDSLVVFSRNIGTAANRPKLTVTYTLQSCAPQDEVQGALVSRSGTAIEICWDPGTDNCVESYRVLGASAPESAAGFRVLVESTGLVECTTLHTDDRYFLVVGQDVEQGPWGHYGQ